MDASNYTRAVRVARKFPAGRIQPRRFLATKHDREVSTAQSPPPSFAGEVSTKRFPVAAIV
jgi:hypothetical protein